jgi:cell division protein FtsI/penicillin-binding protein 2
MNAVWLLKVYACICALLVVSYLLFELIYRVSVKIGLTSSHRNWTRVAQSLLIVSILSPVALAFGAEQSLRSLKPVNPGTLVTDPSIQAIADKVLEDAIRTEKAKAGFAIVADPNTGRILAVANIDTTQKRTGHWALGQMLEQASLFKGIVAAHAIDRGLTTRTSTHSCENGNYSYNGKVYHDWKKEGWSSLTTDETIAHSSDLCSMKIGEKIGPDGLVAMLENFGFGPQGTAKDLPEARTGNLPVAESKPDLVPYVVSGFHFESTPIEILQAYGAIANGGNLMLPTASTDSQQLIRRVLSPEASHEAKEMLRNVVLKGTGKPAQSPLYTTAGKTATAWSKSYIDWMNGHYGDFAGFVGFAPVDKPRVEIYVAIRGPESKDGAHGSTHAAPVFRRLAEEVLQLMNVAPDQTQ